MRSIWSGKWSFTAVALGLASVACSDTLDPSSFSLQILSPAAGDSVLAGDTLVLRARLVEADGTPVPGILIRWRSGTGDSLAVGDAIGIVLTQVGALQVVASTELPGGTVSASRFITVRVNTAPTFSFLPPPARGYDTDTLVLAAAATDLETADARIEWRTPDDGLVGVGDTLRWVPGRGPRDRLLTISAIDAQGNVTVAFDSVAVLPTAPLRWTIHAPDGARGTTTPLLALSPTGAVVANFYGGGACNTCLYAFASDGTLEWQVDVGEQLLDHSAGLTFAPDGSAFVFGFGGGAHRLSPSGVEVWNRPALLGSDPHGRWVLAPDGALFAAGKSVSATGGTLVRVDPATGADLWRITRPGGYSAGPVLASDGTLGVSFGTVHHRFSTDGVPVGDSLTGMSARFVSAGDGRGFIYYPRSSLRDLVAVGPTDQTSWNMEFSEEPHEPVIAADSTIVVAAGVRPNPGALLTGTTVRALGPDGAAKWATMLVGPPFDHTRLALLADGSLVVTAGRYLYRLDLTAGTVLDTVEFTAGIISAIAVAPDNTIYGVTEDARLVAVRGWAPLDPNAPWPIWRRDNARTASVPKP